MSVPAGTLAVLLGLGGAANAQTPDIRDRLVDLATIEVTAELCHIDLTDAQTDRIAAIRNTMSDEGTATASDMSEVHDQIAATLVQQEKEGLCLANGPGLSYFNKKLATLGVP